ncbi:MAG: hypothetical protein IKJ67_00785 [Bacteroidales bacterium]|nr:hypothetical protein [Bacteroidales bacterium]
MKEQIKRKLWLMISVAVIAFASCGDEPEELELPKGTIAKVLTNNVTEVGSNSATCGGYVTADGENTVTKRGVCYATEPNPTIKNNITEDGDGLGSYTSNIENLMPNTLYYVRAYAVNARGVAYGEQRDFTTTEPTGGRTPSGFINGYGYVDLGLSVKWATANMGASQPSDFGEYYAWGEIVTKNEYTEENCTSLNIDLNDIKGNPKYDVARAKWGSTWRMPTPEEMRELKDSCTWRWTMQEGNIGALVVGPNGNSIFLPAAGLYTQSSSNWVGEYGFYWSSQPYGSELKDAYYLFFNRSSQNVDWSGRSCGHTVRPVSN